MVVTLPTVAAFAISRATFIFLAIESTRVNFTSGKRMARGIPGRPPPVPTSATEVPGRKVIRRAMARLWSRWLVAKFSISFLEMTFIFSFQSLTALLLGERREVFFSDGGQIPLFLFCTVLWMRTFALKSRAFTVPIGRLSSEAISS